MTNTQRQCLLCYLGYYTENIDGLWGTRSEVATKQFQRDYGLATDGVFGKKTEALILKAVCGTAKPVDWWKNIKYFKKSEFACKCGGKYCNGYPVQPQRKLVEVADRVREYFGATATVSSGIRCDRHNTNVGGVTNSRHKLGKAMDFRISGKTAKEVLAYVNEQPEIRYAYAINENYVHMDIE